MNDIIDFILQQTKNVLAIDSPTGFTSRAADYVMEEYRKLGYAPVRTNKGGILVCVSEGNGAAPCGPEEGPILLEAHIDTLGAMVSEVRANGRLSVTPLGGMNPNNGEAENCRIYTREGKVYDGTFQLKNASVHVNGEYSTTARSYDTMEVVLDEEVSDREGVLSLGILPGDIVCFDPRTVVTPSGYIKSRFLDDKACCAILLAYAKYVKEEKVQLKRQVWVQFSVYEEIGTGGATLIPRDAHDIIAVDMGCVGELQAGTERKVSLCAKDSKGPYSYELLKELALACKENGVDYAVDTYFRYGSDVEGSLVAGYDARHMTMGPGVYASHGYERTHISALEQTFQCIRFYLEK